MHSPTQKIITIICLLLTNTFTALGFVNLSCNNLNIPDSLPKSDLLFATLDTFHAHQLAANLAEFEESNQGNWMNYMPSAGVGYAPVYNAVENSFTAKPRPSISWSINQVFTAKKRKEALRAKKRSITEKSLLQSQTDKRKLNRLLINYQRLKEDLKERKRLFAIEEELFEYYEKSYQNLDLLPSQFLLRKKDFLSKKYEIRIAETKIKNAEAEILETACYHTHGFSSPEFNAIE